MSRLFWEQRLAEEKGKAEGKRRAKEKQKADAIAFEEMQKKADSINAEEKRTGAGPHRKQEKIKSKPKGTSMSYFWGIILIAVIVLLAWFVVFVQSYDGTKAVQVNQNPTRNPAKTDAGVRDEKPWIVSLGLYSTATALKLIDTLEGKYLKVSSETIEEAKQHSSRGMVRIWIGPYKTYAIAQGAADRARGPVYAVAGPDPIIRDMSAYNNK